VKSDMRHHTAGQLTVNFTPNKKFSTQRASAPPLEQTPLIMYLLNYFRKCIDTEHYRRLVLRHFTLQTVDNVLAFLFRNALMFSGCVAGQKDPQYDCYC